MTMKGRQDAMRAACFAMTESLQEGGSSQYTWRSTEGKGMAGSSGQNPARAVWRLRFSRFTTTKDRRPALHTYSAAAAVSRSAGTQHRRT